MNLLKNMPQKLWIWCGALVILGVAFVVLGKENPKPSTEGNNLSTAGAASQSQTENSVLATLEKSMESKLTASLSKINGVGQVQVMVTLSTGLQSDYARNESVTERKSTESDNSGGTRETTETTENNQLVTPNGTSAPVIVKEQRPEVAGVLVIAQGAKDAKIKETIHSAVKVLLDIPANKIAVESMEGN